MSLAVFAALVAAITVVASMTVIAAVGLLFYSSVREEGGPYENLSPIYDATEHGVTVREGPLPLGDLIDARRLVGFFDEEESSLSTFDPTRSQAQQRYDTAAFGSPEWTEEEGATEIFSAHTVEESEAAFADFEDIPTRLAGPGAPNRTPPSGAPLSAPSSIESSPSGLRRHSSSPPSGPVRTG